MLIAEVAATEKSEETNGEETARAVAIGAKVDSGLQHTGGESTHGV